MLPLKSGRKPLDTGHREQGRPALRQVSPAVVNTPTLMRFHSAVGLHINEICGSNGKLACNSLKKVLARLSTSGGSQWQRKLGILWRRFFDPISAQKTQNWRRRLLDQQYVLSADFYRVDWRSRHQPNGLSSLIRSGTRGANHLHRLTESRHHAGWTADGCLPNETLSYLNALLCAEVNLL